MSFFGTSMGSSPGARSALFTNSAASRSDILGRKYQPFANPFFDLASTYTPPSVKGLFGFCRHYHLTHGIINAINTKAAEYPITELLLSHKDSGVSDKWSGLMQGVLNYRIHQLEVNLDNFVYGNAFVSPSLPFRKMLKCGACSVELGAMENRAQWRFINDAFWLSCPKCGQTGWAKASDQYQPRINDMSLIRWNPEYVDIFYNESTGRTDYSLSFSPEFCGHIRMGRKDLIATTPQAVLEAVRTNRGLVFDNQSVFHMRRPGISQMGRWGVPLMMPVLKDAFYMQIMKKAQEAVLLQHLVPQVFLFPQPATGGADPFTSVSLSDWRDHIRRELARQRMDPAYYGILPFPLGHQTIGENGKSLLLMPEIEGMAQHICIGMGFPADLIFGQGSYAGSSVNMRMLENFFMGNVHGHLRLVAWVMKHFGAFLNWPVPTAKFKAFRMADDVQRQALMLQLRQTKEISSTTLLGQTDLKFDDELELQRAELDQLYELQAARAEQDARAQERAQVLLAKTQAKAQAAAQSTAALAAAQQKSPFDDIMGAGLNRGPQVTLDGAAAALAKELLRMPPARRETWLAQLRTASPEMEQLVLQQQGVGLPQPPQDAQQQAGQQEMQPGVPGIDMRAAPEKLPPRRQGAVY